MRLRLRPLFVLGLLLASVAACRSGLPLHGRTAASYVSPWMQRPAATGYSDTLRALVVLVKFKDDTHPGDPALRSRGWPLYDDPTRLPPFAQTLLATTPTPPFPDSTLTSYFYDQSRGRFVLIGDVYDRVIVSANGEAAYHRPTGGYGDLALEVLDRLDRDGMDYTRYDYNRDGNVDQIFMILRRDSQRDAKKMGWTGISCLDARCGGGLAAGPPHPAPRYDGVTVDWNRSGSWLHHRTPGNVDPQSYHVRLMAHEFGHDLWARHFVHVRAITTNDLPFSSNRGKKPTQSVGYTLMAGAGGGMDCGGSYTISAYERDQLGWIQCDVVDAGRDSVRLGDLYATSGCVKVPLGESAGTLYLSHLQRVGYFDRYRRGGATGQFELGLLRTTGLLVMVSDGHNVDVIPADGTLALGNTNTEYEGDLFGPTGKRQLTPWTRPNSNGYMRYPEGYRQSWVAVDRIRYEDDRNEEIVFDVVPDFRTRPTIREDSWIGAETQDYRFDVPVVVEDQRTLTIETDVTLGAGVVLEPGSRVRIAPGSRVHVPDGALVSLANGAEVIVEGTLLLDGSFERSGSARIVRRGDGRIVAP